MVGCARDRNKSQSLVEGFSLQSEPNWISNAKLVLEESQIDIKAAHLLANEQSEGVKRRRLFLLQQSLEKSSKGAIVALGLILLDVGRLLVSGHYLRGNDMRAHKSTKALEEKISKTVLPRMSGSLGDFKIIGHDPALSLQTLSMLEGIYSFSKEMRLNPIVTAEIRGVLDVLRKRDVSKVMKKIEEVQASRIKYSEKRKELDPHMSRRGLSHEQQLKFVEEAAIPNLVADVLQIFLYLCLASCLADFEQACRYPGRRIPSEVLDNLDKVELYAEEMNRHAMELYEGNGDRINSINKMRTARLGKRSGRT